jgi:hypothetical protein
MVAANARVAAIQRPEHSRRVHQQAPETRYCHLIGLFTDESRLRDVAG